MQLKQAELCDIDSTLKLHAKYNMDNILRVNISKGDLEELATLEDGLFIAKNENRVLAYIMVGSWEFWSRWERFEFMMKDLDRWEYLGQTLTTQNSCLYGGICIDESVQGSGMLETLFNMARVEMNKIYPILVTSINKTNNRAYEAHKRKVGLTTIGEFKFDNNIYWKLVYDTSKQVNLSTLDDIKIYSGKPFIFTLDYPIEYIDYEDILIDEIREDIYDDMQKHYYWSDDFSPEFYVAQAKAGFIAVTMEHEDDVLIMPEIQKNYAILDFKDLHISKKVNRLLKKKNLEIEIGQDFDEVALAIREYHGFTWLREPYLETIKGVNMLNDNCEMITAVIRNEKGVAIAGEIGYIIGRTYTSLTGFSSKEKQYANYGTAQLVLLSQFLEQSGFAFLNFGQPYMPYKLDLGAKVYSRRAFLERWQEEI